MSDSGRRTDSPPSEVPASARSIFDVIYRECSPFVMRLLDARRDVGPASAEDLHQLAMLALLYLILSGVVPVNPKGMLTVLLRHETSKYKQRRRAPVAYDPCADERPSGDPDPEAVASLVEAWKRLEANLGRLSSDERELVELVDLEGMSLAEVARQQGRPVDTLTSRRRRAFAKLAKMEEDDEGSDG